MSIFSLGEPPILPYILYPSMGHKKWHWQNFWGLLRNPLNFCKYLAQCSIINPRCLWSDVYITGSRLKNMGSWYVKYLLKTIQKIIYWWAHWHILLWLILSFITHTAWKVPKYGAISGPFFPVADWIQEHTDQK